jgi:predicted RNase H-like nuclease
MQHSGRMREVLIGFDSAWTDSLRNPGAIAACVLDGGQHTTFHQPRLATFGEALRFTEKVTAEADFVLIAIDQPTVVPNLDGCRPVDRVAGSVISRLGGGVQPARRGGMGAAMFGDGAPIWKFLANVNAIQNPLEARRAPSGRFLMEVFPALALPAIVPTIWERRRAAKYNPAASKFDPPDWPIVASGVATFVRGLGADDLAEWVNEQASREAPRKADQDHLDAAICLAIALAWRLGPPSNTLQIGDEQAGYMATIASVQTRAALVKAAEGRGVAIDRGWGGSVAPAAAILAPALWPVAQTGSSGQHESPSTKSIATPPGHGAAHVDPIWLRAFLIDRARLGSPITYGGVAAALGYRWSQGFGTSLTRALGKLAVENRKASEPLLMCLVVNKTSRMPGSGFYESIGSGDADHTMQQVLLDREVELCRQWSWR